MAQIVSRRMLDLVRCWRSPLAIALTISLILFVSKRIEGFRLLEWNLRDQFFRIRQQINLQDNDEPLALIVTIGEQDIQALGEWPISDATLTQLIQSLNHHSPRVIGLDLYRNLPHEPGHQELQSLFETTPNLIGVERILEPQIPPSETLERLGQVAFSDIIFDTDHMMRRGLLTAISPEPKPQQKVGLAAQIALQYLEAEGVMLEIIDPNRQVYQLGQTTIAPIRSNESGYQKWELGGYQVYLNWLDPDVYFPEVSLMDVLDGRVLDSQIRDRFVVISSLDGTTAQVLTPLNLNAWRQRKPAMTGAMVHATLASQLIYAARSGRPMLDAWHPILDHLWIWGWTTLMAITAWEIEERYPVGRLFIRQRLLWIGLGMNGGLLVGSFLTFCAGWFIPTIVPIMGMLSGMTITVIANKQFHLQATNQQLQAKNRQLQHMATHDSLTNLPNRAWLMEALAEQLHKSKRDSTYQFALLFLDGDRFKVINDSLGHITGDQLLMALGKRILQFLPPGYTATRLGGDEFTILIPDVKEVKTVQSFAKQLLNHLQSPFFISQCPIVFTVSAGIVMGNAQYDKPNQLLRDADTAMYAAKRLGRSQAQLFQSQMHDKAIETLQVETELRRAINHNELLLHYQPLVDLKNGQIDGFEALVRWNHPERGRVSPGLFIPIAEETDLVIPLGAWVLKQGCVQMQNWHQQLPLHHSKVPDVCINLSVRQFIQEDLIKQIDQILAETGLSPRSLKLEITESALMENPHVAGDILLQLRQRGIQIALDDFGTGYSSLSYLHQFPVDTLKIDQSFVRALGDEANAIAIIESIITLSHNLNIKVVAEGIETPYQRDILTNLGCDVGQGYLFAKPLEKSAAESFLNDPHDFLGQKR